VTAPGWADREHDDSTHDVDGNRIVSGDVDEVAAEGNRIVGARARSVLDYIVHGIVDDPDAIDIEVEERRDEVVFRLHVAPSDMGRVIGKRGRVAQAIRRVTKAAGATEGCAATVDIVD
jgi:predicted RNA-binding protein YlqC (UPF0109 family)